MTAPELDSNFEGASLVTTNRYGFVLGAAVLLAPLGCGDSGGDDDVGFADARPGGPDAAVADAGPADALPMPDAPMNSDGPMVTVVSPTAPAAGDFSSAAIVTEGRFTARCRVQANSGTGDPVDPTSVRLSAIGAAASVEAMALPTSTANEYAADLDVSALANGQLQVRCTAADTEARTNSDEIATFLDLGPRIDLFSPMADSSFAQQMDVVFKVTAAPVAAGDTGAAPDLDGVQVSISGTAVTNLTHDATGLFQGTVQFDDPIFDPELEGPNTLVIRAPNTRTATAVTRSTSVVFEADSSGPSIIVDSPDPGELVAGIVALTATVTDAAGVDDGSVVATIAGVHTFELVEVGTDVYQGFFDTRVLGGMVFPTIVVRAKDSVGNQSSHGFVVALDNKPPIASLDPPMVREASYSLLNERIECSWLFDPLGDDAVDDGESVPQLSELRARIDDLGNSATAIQNEVVIPYGGVDPTTVQLWIVDDSSKALIVDTDGDGICDEINPKLVPTSVPAAANEAAVIDLAALTPTGASYFVPPDPLNGQPDYLSTPPEDQCNPPELDGELPLVPPVCSSSPLRRVTETHFGHDPVIYTIPPVGGDQCLGNPLDSVATNLADGWACAAVRAEDNLGNAGISPPMRICFDHDGDLAEGCLPWGMVWNEGTMGALEDCTGTYDAMTDTVDAAADCTLPLTFADDPFFQLIRKDI